jgi:hypothetical protein
MWLAPFTCPSPSSRLDSSATSSCGGACTSPTRPSWDHLAGIGGRWSCWAPPSGARLDNMTKKISSFHVGIAAEAFAAALFAQCGADVSVQYGADQPGYDLIVAKGDKLLKVSVKGSQDGSWGLTQSHLEKANYHGAIEAWLRKHGPRILLCFVQFRDVRVGELPRVYLAWPAEVAAQLKAAAKGRGDTILYEEHQWGPRAHAAGMIESIPGEWRFSEERVEELFAEA